MPQGSKGRSQKPIHLGIPPEQSLGASEQVRSFLNLQSPQGKICHGLVDLGTPTGFILSFPTLLIAIFFPRFLFSLPDD